MRCSERLPPRPLALAAALLAAAAPAAARAEFALVDPAHPPCPIHVASNAPALEQKAAAQLAAYLGRMAATNFAVVQGLDALPARAIVVGRAGLPDAADLPVDGFAVRARDGRLYLAGRNPAATLYAVYAFLEEELGCRWWSVDEEDVPARPEIAVGDVDLRRAPAFAIHDLMNVEAQTPQNDFRYKSRATSGEGFTGSHSLYPLLTPYATNHPDIYPMDKEGVRKANNLHFCYLAPGIAEALAAALERQVVQRGSNVTGVIYFAGMGDWYGGMCECPDCRKAYEEETWTDPDGRLKPGYTGTLLRMINRTAGILADKYPGIRVGTFAYMSLEAPPGVTVPASNVVIRIPRLRHCTVHASQGCEKNASYLRNLQRWGELAPGRVYIWEYGANFSQFLYPFPCLDSIAENIRYYRQAGVNGVMVQGNYVTTGGDLAVLKNYVWRKLLWDPSRETDTLRREFCAGYYGPAADAVFGYVDALEAAVREPEMVHADEFAKFGSYLKAPAREALREWRRKAIAAAGEAQPWARRVREATAGIEMLDLDTPTLFREEAGALVKDGAAAPTYARAVDAVAHNRNAGPNEWGTGLGYWIRFLRLQGGPVAVLKDGDLEASVAPVLNGQIRRLTWKGTELLQVSTDVKDKAYPMLGGSLLAGPGSGILTIEGQAAAGKVEMNDGLAIGKWRFNRKAQIRETVRVSGGRTLTVEVSAADPKSFKPAPATVTTVYRAGAGPAAPKVEVESADGEWKPAPLRADMTEFVLAPEVRALRIGTAGPGITVEDRYVQPAIAAGKITYDVKAGTLTTVVQLIDAASKEPGAPFLTREVTLVDVE